MIKIMTTRRKNTNDMGVTLDFNGVDAESIPVLNRIGQSANASIWIDGDVGIVFFDWFDGHCVLSAPLAPMLEAWMVDFQDINGEIRKSKQAAILLKILEDAAAKLRSVMVD